MGRPKGRVNKISSEARELIAEAFKRLGGVNGLVAWAQKDDKHMSMFYSRMYMKLVPSHMNVDMNVEGHVVRNYTGLMRDDLQRPIIEAEASLVHPQEEPERILPRQGVTPVTRSATGQFVTLRKPNGHEH